MKRILAYLLFAITVFGQKTENNLTIRTNLIAGKFSISSIPNVMQGSQLLSDEQGLATTDPAVGYFAVVKTGTAAGQWYWDSTSTATEGDGVISAIGYVTGRWLRLIALTVPEDLDANKGVVIGANKALQQSTATKQQVDNTAMQVATVAAMQALTASQISNGQLIQTGGRNSNGDGGGALYKYDSSSLASTNLGTIFAPTSGSGRFVWVGGEPINVKMFGAVGYESQAYIPYYSETNTPVVNTFSVWARPLWPTFNSETPNGLMRIESRTNTLKRALEIYGSTTFFTVGVRGTNSSFSPTTTTEDSGYLLWTPNPFTGLSGTSNDFVLTRSGTNWNVYVGGTNYTSTATWVNRPGANYDLGSGGDTVFSVGVVSTRLSWSSPIYRASLWDRVLSSGEIAAPASATGAIAQMTNSVGVYTDSAEAIQAAIDYASAYSGDVWFPGGSYFANAELKWKYGVDLSGVPSDYGEDAGAVVTGSRIVNLSTSTNRAVLIASADYLTSQENLLNPTTWSDGTYGYNKELQGSATGLWLNSFNYGDAIWLDKVASAKLSRLTLTTDFGYLARIDAGNVIELNSVAGYSLGGSRPIRFYNTADTIVVNCSVGGTIGQVFLLAPGNKNLFSGNMIFNSAASTDSWVPTVSTNTGIFTKSAHNLLLGQTIFFEGDSGGTPPEPFASATTPVTNGVTAYWGPYYAVSVSGTTFGVNTRYSTNLAGSSAAMQGTYLPATTTGSGTWRVSTGPEANIGMWASSGNTITGNRSDQSYLYGISSFDGYANTITGNNLAEAGYYGSTNAAGILFVGEDRSVVVGNTFGKIRELSNGDYGVRLATASTDIALGPNTYTSLTFPVSVSSDSSLSSLNATTITNINGDSIFQSLSAARGSSETNGFVYVPEMSGNPSGTPGAYTGNRPIIPVTSTRRLYTHSGSAWLYAPMANAASANTIDLTSGNVWTFSNGTSPAISTSGSAAQIALITTGTETVTAQASSDTLGNSPSISFYRSKGTPAAPTQVTDGFELFDIIANARDNAGSYQFNIARIRALASDDITSTTKGGVIEIRTTLDAGTAEAARVFIGGANGATQIAPGGAGAAAASAALDVSSTTLGFLPPRMTTVQRDAISAPAEGLIIFNTTDTKLQVRAGAAWVNLH